MHGVKEDAWELPENRQERIYVSCGQSIVRFAQF